METDETPKPQYDMLPTGKPHVSFSEVKLWRECSWRHSLTHVKKVGIDSPSPVLSFGTSIHLACEEFLRTRVMNVQTCIEALIKDWGTHAGVKGFDEPTLVECIRESHEILAEVPAFLDREFPQWETVDAEHQLYEPLDNHPHAFKGFIDGIIKAKGKRGEDIFWILDWKTSRRGWFRDKRSDDMVKSQLALYKHFWLKKQPDLKLRDVRCGFVILKRNGKPGDHCELFTVSVGDVPIERSLKVVDNMVRSVKKGVALKNRDACMWCEYRGTKNCT